MRMVDGSTFLKILEVDGLFEGFFRNLIAWCFIADISLRKMEIGTKNRGPRFVGYTLIAPPQNIEFPSKAPAYQKLSKSAKQCSPPTPNSVNRSDKTTTFWT